MCRTQHAHTRTKYYPYKLLKNEWPGDIDLWPGISLNMHTQGQKIIRTNYWEMNGPVTLISGLASVTFIPAYAKPLLSLISKASIAILCLGGSEGCWSRPLMIKELLLTLSAHAQWGVQYLVCLSVCPCVSPWDLALQASSWHMSDTNGFSKQVRDNKYGTFAKTMAFEI